MHDLNSNRQKGQAQGFISRHPHNPHFAGQKEKKAHVISRTEAHL